MTYWAIAQAQAPGPSDTVTNAGTYSQQFLYPVYASVSPQEYLRSLAGDDFDLLYRIAVCESGFQQVWNSRHDENPNYFTAYGIFQITRGTALETDPSLDRFDPLDNIRLAVELFHKEGTTPWSTEAGGNTDCWK